MSDEKKVKRRKNRKYDPATRSAVMAMLLQGHSNNYIRKKYDVPKGTLSNWRRKAMQAAQKYPKRATTTQSMEERGAEIGELLLESMKLNLQAVHAISRKFQDQDWLDRQEANALAVSLGVITDKTVRLLEAMAVANQKKQNATGEPIQGEIVAEGDKI